MTSAANVFAPLVEDSTGRNIYVFGPYGRGGRKLKTGGEVRIYPAIYFDTANRRYVRGAPRVSL